MPGNLMDGVAPGGAERGQADRGGQAEHGGPFLEALSAARPSMAGRSWRR
jgi:hypothetical protein